MCRFGLPCQHFSHLTILCSLYIHPAMPKPGLAAPSCSPFTPPAPGAFYPQQALQFRLREDLRSSGGDLSAFDQLKEARGLEYELDRLQNRASRDKQASGGAGGSGALGGCMLRNAAGRCGGWLRSGGWFGGLAGRMTAAGEAACNPIDRKRLGGPPQSQSLSPILTPTCTLRPLRRCSRRNCGRRWRPTLRCRHRWARRAARAGQQRGRWRHRTRRTSRRDVQQALHLMPHFLY